MVNLPAKGTPDWDDEVVAAFVEVEADIGTATANAASAISTANSANATANAASASAAAAEAAVATATTAAATASAAAATAQSTANEANRKASRVFHAAEYADLPAAVAAASAAGGGVVSLANPSGSSLYTISSALTIPPGVSLVGDNSKLTDLTRSTIKLNSASACVKFQGGDARGGRHGGFNIDANGTGSTTGAMQVTAVQQVFDGITITNAPGVGLYVYATQNTEFRSVDTNGCQDNVVVDGGSGGLKWTRCENTSPTRYGLWVRDSAPGGHPSFGYQFGAADNKWDTCIFEHYAVSATNLVRIDSGSRNHFHKCGFSVNGATLTDYVVSITNDDFPSTTITMVEFTSCNFHGGALANRPIFYIKGTNALTGNVLVVNGHTFFQQSTAVFNTDGGTVGVIDDQSNYYAGTVTAKFGSLVGANWFLWRKANPTGIILATPDASGAWAGHTPLAIRKSTDSAVGARMYVENDGKMGWADGTNFVAQVTASPDLTNDVLSLSGVKHNKVVEGLTVGNVTVASTPVTTDVSAGGPEYGVAISGTGSMASWTLTNPVEGQVITLLVYRTAAQAVAWPTNCRFAGGAAPADPSAGSRNSVTFKYNSGADLWYEQCRAANVPNA